jgi:hypothetical protein
MRASYGVPSVVPLTASPQFAEPPPGSPVGFCWRVRHGCIARSAHGPEEKLMAARLAFTALTRPEVAGSSSDPARSRVRRSAQITLCRFPQMRAPGVSVGRVPALDAGCRATTTMSSGPARHVPHGCFRIGKAGVRRKRPPDCPRRSRGSFAPTEPSGVHQKPKNVRKTALRGGVQCSTSVQYVPMRVLERRYAA